MCPPNVNSCSNFKNIWIVSNIHDSSDLTTNKNAKIILDKLYFQYKAK